VQTLNKLRCNAGTCHSLLSNRNAFRYRAKVDLEEEEKEEEEEDDDDDDDD